jgi:FKBP-type peptidyl-prolyl cis-trans isomerase FkpA
MQNILSSAKTLIIVLLGLYTFSSCNKEDSRIEEEKVKLQEYLDANGYNNIEPTNSGLYHVVISDGDGVSPERTDYVNINFTASLVDGTVFETSDRALAVARNILREDKLYGPAKFPLETLGILGLREGILLMKEGGRSKLIIPSNLGFGSTDYGTIPPYSTLIYEVELLDVISDPEEHEQGLLDQFVAENEIVEEPTESGLYYIETEAGTGDLPEINSVIKIHYTGSLLDGREFDTSRTGSNPSPISFALDSPNIIPGMIEGIKKMREGGKARIIIPWDIGYGAQGSAEGIIPPYSTLVFDIELVEID